MRLCWWWKVFPYIFNGVVHLGLNFKYMLTLVLPIKTYFSPSSGMFVYEEYPHQGRNRGSELHWCGDKEERCQPSHHGKLRLLKQTSGHWKKVP